MHKIDSQEYFISGFSVFLNREIFMGLFNQNIVCWIHVVLFLHIRALDPIFNEGWKKVYMHFLRYPLREDVIDI